MKYLHSCLIPLNFLTSQEMLMYHQQNTCSWLKTAEESDDYEKVSYDVESLFTSIPVKETTDYIIQIIYVKKEIKPFCKKSIFIKILKKLTQERVFTITSKTDLSSKSMAVVWVG